MNLRNVNLNTFNPHLNPFKSKMKQFNPRQNASRPDLKGFNF